MGDPMNSVSKQLFSTASEETFNFARSLGWFEGREGRLDAGAIAGPMAALGLDTLPHQQLVLCLFDLSLSRHLRQMGPFQALEAFAAGRITDPTLLQPFFDIRVYQRRRGIAFATLRDALADFLAVGQRERVSPTALFHAESYKARYPDLAGYPNWLFAHFLRHGAREGRAPGLIPDPNWFRYVHPSPKERYVKEWIDPVTGHLRPLSLAHKTSLSLGNLPQDSLEVLSVIGAIEQLAFARHLSIEETARLFELLDVRLLVSDCDGGIDDMTTVVSDWAAGRYPEARVSHLFDAQHYEKQVSSSFASNVDALLHWVGYGVEARISPTPLFDEAFYCWQHRDLRAIDEWTFWHFLRHGLVEGRRPSPLFNSAYFTSTRSPLRRPALLDYLDRQNAGEAVRPDGGWPVISAVGLDCGTNLAEIASQFAERKIFDYRKNGVLHRLITQANSLEPQIKFYDDVRQHSVAPFNAPHLAELQQARQRIGRADILILRDQITFGGVDIVGAHLSSALRQAYPGARIVVISTLGPALDGCAEAYEAAEHVDLSDIFSTCPAEVSARLMHDILMGSQCHAAFILNSLFGWEAIRKFGRQIANTMLVYGYFFCDDRDVNGEVDGYPSRYFIDCMLWVDQVFFDSKCLYDEFARRMLNSAVFKRKTSVLRTPGLGLPPRLVERWRSRKRNARPTIGWAGRFDRQKRVDLLLEIARNMPDADFVVWGKAVLDADDYDWDLPNLKLAGMFRDYEEIVDANIDVFLYTSAWDGVPTILLTIGEIGIPTVATDVGGVAEAVPRAGLVAQSAGPEKYIDRLRQFVASNETFSSNWARIMAARLEKRAPAAFRERLSSKLGPLDDRLDDHCSRAC